MLLFKQTEKLDSYLSRERKQGRTVGFVPTMGALHEGHLSLLRASRRENELTVCSIFVNPTQFNDPEDLRKYPRTIERDTELLASEGCDLLFWPTVGEIYPDGTKTADAPPLDLEGLDKRMEGAHRPGHFKGVVQVVHRLLDIVKPHRLYMGQKDFQQFTIIRHMIVRLQLPVDLVVGPTVREADGLAMSSRNRRLSPEARQSAPLIFQTLQQAAAQIHQLPPEKIRRQALEKLDAPPLRPEYFELVDGRTLMPVQSADQTDYIVACTAVWAEDIRLIDNTILKKPEDLRTI